MIDKRIENKLARSLKMAIMFGNIDMPAGKPYKRRCFHDTYLMREDGMITELGMNHTDWEAIWVTPDETAAEKFATSRYKDSAAVPAVYEGAVSLSTALSIDLRLAGEISDEFGIDDIREAIPDLRHMGYDGWVTLGSIGGIIHEDVAVFDESLITFESVKLMNGDSWTSYVRLNGLDENEIFNSDELERFTRVMHP